MYPTAPYHLNKHIAQPIVVNAPSHYVNNQCVDIEIEDDICG